MDAAALLLELHGRLLRAACLSQDVHFEGLGAAGRHLGRAGVVPPRIKNLLIKMDLVCGFVHHISKPRADSIFEEIESMLAAVEKNAPVKDPVEMLGEKIDPLTVNDPWAGAVLRLPLCSKPPHRVPLLGKPPLAKPVWTPLVQRTLTTEKPAPTLPTVDAPTETKDAGNGPASSGQFTLQEAWTCSESREQLNEIRDMMTSIMKEQQACRDFLGTQLANGINGIRIDEEAWTRSEC